MGQLHAHRHPRGLRGRGPLIVALLGLALAGEIAVPGLSPSRVLMVNGVAYDGGEARGLPGGAHQTHVVEGNGRLVFRRRVLLREDERVELDIENPLAPETYRGSIPEREEADPSTEPQLLVVGSVEWRSLRLHLDGVPMPLDPDTRTFRRVLEAGPHRLERLVAGRPKPPVELVIAGAPWQCAVGRDGSMDCVELVDHSATAVDVATADAALQALPAKDRQAYLLALEGQVSCIDVAHWMDEAFGDEAKLALALGMRANVGDPWNHVVLQRALSFPESRRRVEALYGGQQPLPLPEPKDDRLPPPAGD